MERIALLDAELLYEVANLVRGRSLQVALLDVENLVEHIWNVEAECWLRCDVALLGNLLVGEPTTVRKGVLNLVAVVELLL